MLRDGVELKNEKLVMNKEFEHQLEQYICHKRNSSTLELLSTFPQLRRHKFHNHMTVAHLAAKYDNTALLGSLIANGCDLEAVTRQEMQTPLCVCCVNGSVNSALLLIENKVVLDHHDIYGNTPLFYSIQQRNFELAKILLKHGSTYKYGLIECRSIFEDLDNQKDLCLIVELAECVKKYFNRIHLATKLNLTLLLRHYLEKYPHADIDVKNDIGMTSAHIAAKNNCASVVNVLIEYGADFTITDNLGHLPVHLAVKYKSTQVLELLFPNYSAHINTPDNLGYSLLMHGIESGLEIGWLEKFLKIGANFNCRIKKNGNSALHLAVLHRNLDVVKLLLAHHIAVDVKNNDGVTPLHLAINVENNNQIVALLLDAGADVILESKAGMNALFYSLYNGFNNYFQIVLDHCNDVNYINKDGYGALHLACSIGNFDCVKLLTAKGAALDIQGKFGETPLHWAAWRNHYNIAKFLLDSGVAVDSVDQNNSTPLNYSCMKGHLEVSKLFLAHEANPNHINNDGVTPAICAVRSNNSTLVRYLVDDYAIDINYRLQGCYSLMYFAMYCGNLSTVNFLLNKTLALDEVIDDRFTPFSVAVLCDNAELCFQLYSLYNFTCCKPFTSFKVTIVHLIGIAGSIKTFKALSGLRRFRDTLSQPTKFGDTVLHFAATYGHYELCQLLIRFDSHLAAKKNGCDLKPIHCAVIAKQLKVFNLLYQHDNHQQISVDQYGNNLAHLSIIRCSNKITIELLKNAELFEKKNYHGLTPREILSALNVFKRFDLTTGGTKKHHPTPSPIIPNHNPTLEEEITSITRVSVEAFVEILYEYLSATNLVNFADYFSIPKDISVCLRMRPSNSRFITSNRASIEYTHCVFDNEITQCIESHLHSTRILQNQSSSENRGWVYCRIPNAVVHSTKPSLTTTNQDSLMLELVDCGLVAFYGGIMVIIPASPCSSSPTHSEHHYAAKSSRMVVSMKRLTQSNRHESKIREEHYFFKRLSNFLEVAVTERGGFMNSANTTTCYVGFNRQSLVIDTTKNFNYEYVGLLKHIDANEESRGKWTFGGLASKSESIELKKLSSLWFNAEHRLNKFLFYRLEFSARMCCVVCYQPCAKQTPSETQPLSLDANCTIKIIPSNRVRIDRKYSSTFSDIILVEPTADCAEKEFTTVFSVTLKGCSGDLSPSSSISDFKIFRYDPSTSNNYWVLSSQDCVTGVNKNVIDIKIVLSRICYVWIFCDSGGKLSPNPQLLVNRSFTKSINIHYNTLVKLTIMRNRKWINNVLAIFEFSIALPGERKPFIELNQHDFYLTFTKQQEISLTHGQQLQILALVDGKSAGFLDCSNRYLPYINYFADPWTANTFNCYLTPMAFSHESTDLAIDFIDPELDNDPQQCRIARFLVSI